jgi:hypothetical protein
MENLEEEIINRLNKILSKYSLKITNNIYKLCGMDGYQLDDEITYDFICGWESIDEMLFDSSSSLFYRLSLYYKNVDINRGMEFEIYERYADAYNDIKLFENIGSLEELIINLNICGIF